MRGAYVRCNFLGSEDTSRSIAAENIDIIADEANGAGGTVILASALPLRLVRILSFHSLCVIFIQGAAFDETGIIENFFSGKRDVMLGKTHPSLKSPLMLTRLDHVASAVIHANHSMIRTTLNLRAFDCVANCIPLAKP